MTPSASPAPTSLDDLVIELLAEHHDTQKFRCRENELQVYLKYQARSSTEYGYGNTFVAIQPGHPRVWAYYTLSNASIDRSKFPNLPGNPPDYIPAIRIGRMAKDQRLRLPGVGRMLLSHAFHTIVESAERSSAHCVFLDAKNEELKKKVYEPFGFMALTDPDKRLTLFLPMSTVRAMVQAAKSSL